MTDWQPIETAPEEADCLILARGARVFTGWQDSDGVWCCDQYADHMSELSDDEAPTHWMPLPKPPA